MSSRPPPSRGAGVGPLPGALPAAAPSLDTPPGGASLPGRRFVPRRSPPLDLARAPPPLARAASLPSIVTVRPSAPSSPAAAYGAGSHGANESAPKYTRRSHLTEEGGHTTRDVASADGAARNSDRTTCRCRVTPGAGGRPTDVTPRHVAAAGGERTRAWPRSETTCPGRRATRSARARVESRAARRDGESSSGGERDGAALSAP